MLDPKAEFTIISMTRSEIAEAVNSYLENYEESVAERITDDDDRLTDAICHQYSAEMIGAYTEESEDQRAGAEMRSARGVLQAIGIAITSDDEFWGEWNGEEDCGDDNYERC